MSRIGKKPVKLPKGVTVVANDGLLVVKGPKGELQRGIARGIEFSQEGDVVQVTRTSDEAPISANHGLMRALLANMVQGVTQGFARQLEIHGVGFKAEVKGKSLVLNLGFSHQVVYPFPPGITVDVEQNTRLSVKGIDKELVGQVAAELRGLRPPDSYKGKGIRYQGERIRLKAGKAAQK
jgi:large subunit ribosomal protein L6